MATPWALLILAVRLRSTAAAHGAVAFASCPPPRFDAFADATVGRWQYGPSLPDQAGEVEEVMRSCGGAVQGIREIPLSLSPASSASSSGDGEPEPEGRYLNRADDGFVYFDSGSYSAGPVQITAADDDSALQFMASLSFASTPKRRLLVSAFCRVALADDARTIRIEPVDETNTGTIIGLSRVPFRQPEDVDMSELPSVIDLQTFAKPPGYDINWRKEIVCRMASPAQPWMLQRAKWESFEEDSSREHGLGHPSGGDEEEKPTRTDLKGWVRVFDGEEEGATANSNAAIGSTCIQIGALCTVTKEARAVVRGYNAEGKLNGVIIQEGSIIDS